MNFRPDTMLSKIILLYVFDKIEIALTENSIMEICWSRNNWLNYMEIVDILPSLIEMNFISKTKDKFRKISKAYFRFLHHSQSTKKRKIHKLKSVESK